LSSAVGKRRRALPLVPGKGVPVSPAEVAELDAARADLERARNRVRRVTERIRRALGEAEFGFDSDTGEPIIWREQTVTGGGYARLNHRDDLRTSAPRTRP
jgi:hypothetical protein